MCFKDKPSLFVILGLIHTYYTTLSLKASAEPCKSKNISATYQNCGFHPDGVHGLDCFMKRELPGEQWICVWKPGRHTSENIYTLIVQQDKNYCRSYSSVRGNSQKIKIFKTRNLTAQVLENTESENCTKDIFRGSPKSLLRCGPPYNATFRWRSGRLYVNVNWQQNEEKRIQNYTVRYKALDSLLWNESSVQYRKEEGCTVEGLNSSLVYILQIKCVTNKECSQCPWSETHTIPPELTVQPVLTNLEEADITEGKGRRLLSLNWEFSAKRMLDGFYVTIGKASGEPPTKRMNTTRPQIRLILSYSAYHVNISAFNNASISPGSSWTIKNREDNQSSEAHQLNVTVQSNTSFTVYWKDPLVKQYVCYSVEWTKKGHKAAHRSFFENMKNYKELSDLPEPLEPYKRYSLSLHTRPNKNTCNMQYINGSEATYGSTQFYYMEGLPVSAPANISSHSVTLNSAVLQWSPIPEEDVRGFLLGYIIHYTEYHDQTTHTETNMTVAPELNSYELGGLKTGTAYQVQISGFTRAGSGVRSITTFFKTHHQAYFSQLGVTIIFAILAIVLLFASPLLKRVKAVLWPSIPNPEYSKAMQKLEKSCELELLKVINTLKVEEYDTNSLQIIEKEAAIPVSVLPSILPLLHNSEEEEDVPEVTCDGMQRDSEDATGDGAPDNPADTQHTDLDRSQFVFTSGYTTMEMFQQQVMPQTAQTAAPQDVESEPEKVTAWTVVRPGLDYIHQFSIDRLVLDHEDISTVL
ncbi:protein sidekick-2 isoform X2 [Sphaeramia orbicularis]|uniref:protein sidekick-2 isoform X2 n=1 Tax=Sphaeramia orbicularis TaxID=375764 RepID=UPI00117E4DD7|nr:protein sidekick-2-like isoform X2 [Sphaeramia orbicularis]